MPQGFNIGPLTIRYYALLIILGAVAGAWLASRQAKKYGHDPEIVLDLLPWLLIGGIIGARLWHVFTPSASNIAAGVTTENYLKNPIEILKMWKGGLGIPGGVIGGALALWLYTKAKKLNFMQWADFIAPGLLIGQAIGRWGNFVNQEVYGKPSDLPWAITIDPPYRISGFEHVSKYHPLFLYESLLALIGAGILLLIDKKWHKKLFKGDLLWLYLIYYPTVRFFLEFLRLDPSPVNNINVNQTSMMIVGILAAIVLILRHTVWAEKLKAREEAEELMIEAETEDEVADEDESSEESNNVEDEGLESEAPEVEPEDENVTADLSADENLEEAEELELENNEWIADELPEGIQEEVDEQLPDVDEDEPVVADEDAPDLDEEKKL